MNRFGEVTGNIGILLGIEGELVLSRKIDERFHGREVSYVAVAHLPKQSLQIPVVKRVSTPSTRYSSKAMCMK